MKFWDWLTGRTGLAVDELARRLDMPSDNLRGIRPKYSAFVIPKRAGGKRKILAPSPELKALQRRILHRVLGKLRVHPAVTGFQKGHSIVSNAAFHVGKAVVLRMDIADFFSNTAAKRVENYFRKIGWNREAAGLLTRLCTHEGGLPQGAPTSPRLGNLVNYRLDARLSGLGKRLGAAYTRYADDLTFSFRKDVPDTVRKVIRLTKAILKQVGYRLHQRGRKLQIRRQHQRQCVTGLVVNDQPALPREIRRWLRAVEHHVATGRKTNLSPAELDGWRALRSMVETQRDALR